MKKYILLYVVMATTVIEFPAAGQTSMNHSSSSTAAFQLRTAMRQLWEDHVTWTRNVIFCLTDDLPGADQAVKRLLKNQDDIGNAVSSFYGEAAGKKLAGLLYDHINTAAEVVRLQERAIVSNLTRRIKNGLQMPMKYPNFLARQIPTGPLQT